MPFKINISDKGKTFKVETESEELIGKKIGDKLKGEVIQGDLSGYELEISGTSDKSGFAGKGDVEGIALKRILLTKGEFLKKVPHKGFRRKKSVRGNQISSATIQINTVVVKAGEKKLENVLGKKEEGSSKDDPAGPKE